MARLVRKILTIAFLCVGLSLGAAAEAAPPPSQPAAGPPYRINPGDELDISVWGEDRLQRTVRVLPDGTFTFPLVGQVTAAGRLPSEVERIISLGLQPQYRGTVPQVTVGVKDPLGYQFSVIGKVKSPGTFTPGRYVNALEALSIAGGPSEFAQVGNATIIRKNGQQLQTIRIHLGDALKGATAALGPSSVPPIQTGDTLVIP